MSPLFPEALNITDIPKTKVKFDTYDVAPFTLREQEDMGKVKGRSLCCQVAVLYAKIENFSTLDELVAEKGLIEKPLKEIKVKRLLHKHLEHTL